MEEAITDTLELIKELNRIATRKYEAKDSNRNHQVFASALLWLIRRPIQYD